MAGSNYVKVICTRPERECGVVFRISKTTAKRSQLVCPSCLAPAEVEGSKLTDEERDRIRDFVASKMDEVDRAAGLMNKETREERDSRVMRSAMRKARYLPR